MPTEKRARQKQGRQARLEAQRKVHKRRQLLRRTAIVVVVAGIVVGSVLLITRGSSTPTTTTTTSTSTTSTTTTSTTTTLPQNFARRQAALDAVAAAAGCPRSPSAPANTLAWKHIPGRVITQSGRYSAVFNTDIGSFTISLNTVHAPITVNNFVFLAKQHFYNCGSFFRVIPGFVSQGGSPNQTNSNAAQPGYTIPDENMQSSFQLGDVAMANATQPHTGSSQFFIVAKAQSISGTYALFGHVTAGLGVIEKINADGSPGGVPPNLTHRVLTVTILGPT